LFSPLLPSCAPGVDGSQGPLATDNDDCTLLLTWDTNLVCQDQFEPLQCVVYDSKYNLYDLSSLMQPYVNYHMDTDAEFFEVNICRPMVTLPNSNCPGTAAACLVTKENSVLQSYSLGQVRLWIL